MTFSDMLIKLLVSYIFMAGCFMLWKMIWWPIVCWRKRYVRRQIAKLHAEAAVDE